MATKKTTQKKKPVRKVARSSASSRKKAVASKRKASASKSKAKPKAKPKPKAKKAARKAAPKPAARKKTAAKTRPRKAAARKPARPARKVATKRPAAKKTPTKSASGKKATARSRPAATAGKKAVRKPSSKSNGAAKAAGDGQAVAEAPVRRRKLKTPYSKSQLRPLRKELLDRRLRILADLDLMGDEALRAADPDVDTESVADHGSDAYERNLTLGLMEHDSRTLRKIEEALKFMDDGIYGLCGECEDAIPLPRLEALPFAITCVPCQEKQEGSP